MMLWRKPARSRPTSRNCRAKAIEDRYDIAVGLAIFDTYNKGIAFAGGDEDKARDQNRALANLRRLQERHKALHIAVIGHTGKDESRGSRGSNALPGDADVQNQISSSDDVKVVVTKKANDQPEGEMLRFKLEPYRLGTDEDGDPIEVWITANEVIQAEPKARETKVTKLNPRYQNALNCLVNVCTMSAPASANLPFGAQIATIGAWRDEMRRRGVLNEERVHKDLYDLRNALQAKRVISVDGDHVWPTKY